MIQIGRYRARNNLFLAPMAGVTDLPFRQLCHRYGAGWVVSEMVWSKTELYTTQKTLKRLDHSDEIEPRVIQIAGGDPQMMADIAKLNVEKGAQIIDINMGCPAKKVCNKLAGSALMKDELLVAQILEAVVNAVDVPVTLKTRTGWHHDHKNVMNIAKIAENSGIQMLSIHGRTREQKYTGCAEYDTIAAVKQSLSIPIIANGDITNEEKAKFVLDYTNADGIMIGRAAQGAPWIFQQIQHYLATGEKQTPPNIDEQKSVMLEHLNALHHFYGDYLGVRIARKHIGWYFEQLGSLARLRKKFNQITEKQMQVDYIHKNF